MHLGIDLGGTKTEIIALDADNKELHRSRIDSPQGSYDATLNAITQLVWDTEKKVGSAGSLGIGIPGSLSPTTGLVQNANSTWLIGHPLKNDLSKRLERNIAVANDADCFALSEACDGAGSGYETVFGVILGTGVGGGLIIHQNIIVGPNAITGEWGHNPLCDPLSSHPFSSLPFSRDLVTSTPEPAIQCYCGKYNCIETFLSGPGMLKRFNAHTGESFSRVEQILAISKQASTSSATEALEHYVERLACALSQVVNILDPGAIVLGGGLSNIAALYEKLPSTMLKYVFSEDFRTPIKQAMHGDSSGVRGAAWLGRRCT